MADSLTSSALGKFQLQDELSSSWLEELQAHAESVSFYKNSLLVFLLQVWGNFYKGPVSSFKDKNEKWKEK